LIKINKKDFFNNSDIFKEQFKGHLYVDKYGNLCQILGSKYKILNYN